MKITKVQEFLTFLKTNHGKLQNNTITLGWAFFGLFAERIFTALTLITVAKKVYPLEYGQYIASYSFISFLIVLPGFGLDAWLLTQGKRSSKDIFAYWKNTAQLRIKLLSGWAIGMFLITLLLPKETFPPGIMIPSILGLTFDSLILLGYAAFRNLGNHKWVVIFQVVSTSTLLLSAIIVPSSSYQITIFATIRMAVSVLFAFLMYLSQRTRFHGIPKTISSITLLRESKAFMWAELASAIYVRADITILSLALGALATSIYVPAINILQLTFLAPRALFYFATPILSRAYQTSLESFLRKVFFQLIIQTVLGLILSYFVYKFAPLIINLVFGENYESSGKILLMLSPIPLLRSLNFALGASLTASNYQTFRTRVQIFSASFNVVGNLLIVKIWSSAGVAIIYTLSELILYVGYTWLSLFWIYQIIKNNKDSRT